MEPFCGSCAVLFKRPERDWSEVMETVCDANGLIANVWRAIQFDPDGVAKWCDWPVNHTDLMARKRALNAQSAPLLEKLIDDAEYYDAKLAGYYVWAASCWIGTGLEDTNTRPHLTGVNGIHSKFARNHINDWIRALSERLRYVRVVCGDWSRIFGGNWQHRPGIPVGVFFDPPYGVDDRADCYTVESRTVASDIRKWSQTRANDPRYRIVIAGYFDEHEELLNEGWSVHRWSANGGYGNQRKDQGNINNTREALFMSPHCLKPNQQMSF